MANARFVNFYFEMIVLDFNSLVTQQSLVISLSPLALLSDPFVFYH